MSLIEKEICSGECTNCNYCGTIPVTREDLEDILKYALCDEIRAIVGKYLSDKKY